MVFEKITLIQSLVEKYPSAKEKFELMDGAQLWAIFFYLLKKERITTNQLSFNFPKKE